jgi:hypothetical protein
MRGRRIFAGIVVLAAISAVGWLAVPTAGAADQRIPNPGHQPGQNARPGGAANDWIQEVLRGLHAILATQQSLLNQVNDIQFITLPNQARLLGQIVGIQAELIQEVSGLELACTTPDLVVLPRSGGGHCRIDDQGKLHVLVHNQGGAAAGPSQTLVVFRTASGEQDLFVDTVPLAGFTGTDLAMDIPEGCFGGFFGQDDNNVCKFQILADAKIGSPFGAVAESDELNNAAFGACQGLL